MLIGLTGLKQAGKDTVGNVLVRNHGFVRFAFADRLKDMALAIDPHVATFENQDSPTGRCCERLSGLVDAVGWERAKTFPDVRRLLQRLGKEAVRDHLGENVWVDVVMRQAEPLMKTGLDVVITDVRFLNEYDAIAKHDGMVWRIVRDGQTNTDTHPSETEMAKIPADLVLHNTSIDKLDGVVAEALGRF